MHALRLKDKTAVVTGAASGIGRAAAIEFARNGAAVVLVDIDEKAVKETCRLISSGGGTAISVAGDIADATTAERAVQSALAADRTSVDFLFNNAGTELVKPALETSDAEWTSVMDTNLKGTFLMTRACLEVMVDTGFGVIVNNASDAGVRGIRVNSAYSTSKAGVIQFTRTLALDYAASGVRANCICPGCIRTPLCERFNQEVGERHGISGEEALDRFVKENIPMQRVGTPEEVAGVVIFLCSEDARYINGAVLPIDGGLTAGM